jgi:hypothetical protein
VAPESPEIEVDQLIQGLESRNIEVETWTAWNHKGSGAC